MKTNKSQHGGKRPGAGRPTVEVKKQTFTVVCYPHQIAEIRKFAKELNQKDAPDTNI